jgi:ABC-type antimicrobial peptide transport system permease subunit
VRAFSGLLLLIQDLRHDAPRSLLTVFNLSLVIAIHLAVASLASALALLRSDALTGSHNLLVMSANVLDPMDSELHTAQLEIAAQAAAALGPGTVQKTSPLILRHLRIEGRILQVAAAPTADLPEIYQLRLLQGRWPSSLDEIAVTQSAQVLIGKGLGDALVIYGSLFRIVGLVDVPGNRAGVWMSDRAGQALLGMQRGFQIAVLQLSPQAEPGGVQALLEQEPRLDGFAVYQEAQFSAQFTLSLESIAGLARFFNLLSLLIVSFGAYNVTHLSLVERSPEIGMLRAIGYSAGSLSALVLLRTALLSLLAFGLAWLFVGLYFHLGQEPVMLHVNQLRLELTPSQLARALLLCLAFCGLGALAPGFALFRTNSAELMRAPV